MRAAARTCTDESVAASFATPQAENKRYYFLHAANNGGKKAVLAPTDAPNDSQVGYFLKKPNL